MSLLGRYGLPVIILLIALYVRSLSESPSPAETAAAAALLSRFGRIPPYLLCIDDLGDASWRNWCTNTDDCCHWLSICCMWTSRTVATVSIVWRFNKSKIQTHLNPNINNNNETLLPIERVLSLSLCLCLCDIVRWMANTIYARPYYLSDEHNQHASTVCNANKLILSIYTTF